MLSEDAEEGQKKGHFGDTGEKVQANYTDFQTNE